MGNDFMNQVRRAAAESEFLQMIAAVKQDGGLSVALGHCSVRPLYAEEIVRLEALGNTADDWSMIRVADGFDWRRVKQSSFHGWVVLGRFAECIRVAEGLDLPTGVYRSTLSNCVVGHEALIRDVRILANYVVGDSAVLADCGRISCTLETCFGNGMVLAAGVQGGGREFPVYAEIDVEVAAHVARQRKPRGLLEAYASAVADYRGRALAARGIIGRGAMVQATPLVENTFVGVCARVDGATRVTESTLLSCSDEPTEVASGAIVHQSLLQWGARADSLAIVERSVLTEHACVERHGKVTDSLLGPNTVVGSGEVTSCLLGPFVACHHQSLLISTCWPQGRGNVAYGANVGSNHTSRAPDQELWAGEGMFLGLGANVKFPADFSRAPYTVIACGVNLLPQKVTFPFSLISPPSQSIPGIPGALNEILPAWMLADNLFALRRSEAKIRARNKARRTNLDYRIFRPDTVELMLDACRRLESVHERKDFYTEKDIPGLGKNVLSERNRRKAIEAYRFHILFFAVGGLAEQVREALKWNRDELAFGLLHETSAVRPAWEYQRLLLAEELGITDVRAALRRFLPMLEVAARGVEQSKAKDDVRGAKIIDDYADVHPRAADNEVVRQSWVETRQLQAEIQHWLRRLEGLADAADIMRSNSAAELLQPSTSNAMLQPAPSFG